MEKTKENLIAVFSHPMEKTTELDSSQGRKDTNRRKEYCGLKLRKKKTKTFPMRALGLVCPEAQWSIPTWKYSELSWKGLEQHGLPLKLALL